MTDSTTTALIAATPPTIIAVLSWLSSRRNGKSIQEIHVAINSRLTELLAATKGEATATGHAAGMAEQKANP
jgi:hypothetical protein